MVVNLSVGVWQGYRLDREASRKVTDEAGADIDAARVNKHLVPKESLAPITKLVGALRSHFYTNSLPWKDNGDRLMPRAAYLKFIPEHQQLMEALTDEVEKFLIDDYPRAVAKAEFRMGAMFRLDDYPPARELRTKFYAKLEIDAITSAGDFRVKLDEAHDARVRAEMEVAATARMNNAMGDIWKRMATVLTHFQKHMTDPDSVFKNTTVTNMTDLLDLVPGLNVLGDPDIDAVRLAMLGAFGGIEANDIRKDPGFRQELAGEAGKIMSTMEGFMSAWGGGQQ